MKKALLFALALVTVAPVAVEAQQRLAELVRQGDTYLKRSLVLRRLQPYTGNVIEYYGSREKPILTKVWKRGTLRRGRWHGSYREYSNSAIRVSDMVTEGGDYNMGQRCGRWLEFVYDERSVLGRPVGNKEVIHPPC